MNPWIKDVADFHHKFGVPVLCTPKLPSPARIALRIKLIAEEAKETCDALNLGDIVEAADGLGDTVTVCIGTALELGINMDPVMRAIFFSNMAKEGGATRPDGKILKPPGWVKPDIAGLLRKQGWGG